MNRYLYICISAFLIACATAQADEKKPAAPAQPLPVGEAILFRGGPDVLACVVQPMSNGELRYARAPQTNGVECASWAAELERLQREHGQPYTDQLDKCWRLDRCSRPPVAPTAAAEPKR